VTKTLGFKAWALVASTGLCVAMVSGCNPEEPAKAPTPAPAPKATTPAKPTDTKGAAPAPTPKPEEHTK
jgi:hypothetical protein